MARSAYAVLIGKSGALYSSSSDPSSRMFSGCIGITLSFKNTIVIVLYLFVKDKSRVLQVSFSWIKADCSSQRMDRRRFSMTSTEMIHTKQEGSEWTAAAKRDRMMENIQARFGKKSLQKGITERGTE